MAKGLLAHIDFPQIDEKTYTALEHARALSVAHPWTQDRRRRVVRVWYHGAGEIKKVGAECPYPNCNSLDFFYDRKGVLPECVPDQKCDPAIIRKLQWTILEYRCSLPR